MPEMPEVETIRRSLEKKLLGKEIVDVKILLSRQIKWPAVENFASRLVGRKIAEAARIGKYLLFKLDNGNELIVHLRMTGRLCYKTAQDKSEETHTRVVFYFAGGERLIYADIRTFGALYALLPDERWRIRGLSEMGPEPLSAEFTVDYLQGILQKRRTKIKSILLNQKYIGGLGNIYVDEALFLAGIQPQRTADSISPAETAKLYSSINKVIAEGIADGGTTFRDYRDGEGKKGHHQEKLFVYGRGGQSCRRCQNQIEKITLGGRGTHYCPHCQK